MHLTITENQKQTKRLAGELAKKLIQKKSEKALVIALLGELGSGKTTFVSGFSKALGINEKILSPTFVLIHKHELQTGKRPAQHKGYRSLYHIDAYRLESEKDLLKLNIKKILKDPKNIVMIEWADKVKGIVPKNAIWVYFKHSNTKKRSITENKRDITVIPH